MVKNKVVQIGILALQGDVLEHVNMMNDVLANRNIPSKILLVKRPDQLENLDGLIIPGGESTVMSRLSSDKRFGSKLIQKIREKAKNGMALFGTCAGAILLSKTSTDNVVKGFTQSLLELIDIDIIRNKYGRQQDSFEQELIINALGKKPFPGIFIRAPVIVKVGTNVEILARKNDEIYACRQGKCLAITFHPELSDDIRFHEYFLEMVLS